MDIENALPESSTQSKTQTEYRERKIRGTKDNQKGLKTMWNGTQKDWGWRHSSLDWKSLFKYLMNNLKDVSKHTLVKCLIYKGKGKIPKLYRT